MPALWQAALPAAAAWVACTNSRLDKTGSRPMVRRSRSIEILAAYLTGPAYEIAPSGSSTKCEPAALRTQRASFLDAARQSARLEQNGEIAVGQRCRHHPN